MQDSLFDFPHYSIAKPIRLIELFGGIGSQAMALRDIEADFEHYRLVEFDKYAVASYNAIHGTDFKPTDIRDVRGNDLGICEKNKYSYLLTYSFPCTDLSVAGKMQGMSKSDWESGKSTRSGLLWEVERILAELPAEQLPDILLMENVPQVHSEQNRYDFENWLAFLRKKGYQNFWKDLNAKDYGIPQNRERCFCVSILASDFVDYEFPKPVSLETVMKDYLEADVDEKYYINNDKANELIERLIESGTLPIGDEKEKKPNFLGNFYGRHDGYDGSVFGTNAPVKTITHSKGGVADIVVGGLQEHQTPRTDGVSPSLTAAMGMGGGQTPIIIGQNPVPMNTEKDGTCRTIKSQYAKNSVQNFESQSTFGATGVAQQTTDNRQQTTDYADSRFVCQAPEGNFSRELHQGKVRLRNIEPASGRKRCC